MTELLVAPGIDPLLVRRLAEYARLDKTVGAVCKGDIKVQIDDAGKLSVETQYQHSCPCDPQFLALLAQVSGGAGGGTGST